MPSLAPILKQRKARPHREGRILVDGGIRRGRDIAKAKALGASSVLIGRAVLYGLATAGEEGAFKALTILKEEFEGCMKQLGCSTVNQLTKGLVEHASQQ
ncbi:MAG: hypothetical protein COB58_05310 [Thalassobium sp.]|nr:MAG: hypothetical protein COB58_05310 [Thalassobium sp.]